MKLSVCITTYNHAPYIAKCLDSVLAQKTDFDIEILVGEDDSSDGTRDIVKNYASRHRKIKLFLNDRANVVYINGRPTGRWNFLNNIKHAKGEYLAIMDGDDYWTDSGKLQFQVDFLDQNPGYVLCCHNVRVITNDDEIGKVRFKNTNASMSIHDLIVENRITTNSAVFRNRQIEEFPEWMWTEPKMDFALFVLIAQFGKIHFINEVMSVYRLHDGGVYSTYDRLDDFKLSVAFLKRLENYFGRDLRPAIKDAVANRYFRLAGHMYRAGNYRKSGNLLLLSLVKKPFNGRAFSWRNYFALLTAILFRRHSKNQ